MNKNLPNFWSILKCFYQNPQNIAKKAKNRERPYCSTTFLKSPFFCDSTKLAPKNSIIGTRPVTRYNSKRSSLQHASSSSWNVSLQNSKRPTLCCLCRLNDLLFTYRTSRFFCLDHNFAAWQQYTVLHKKEKSEKTENRYYCQAKKLGSKQENQLILFVNSKALSR